MQAKDRIVTLNLRERVCLFRFIPERGTREDIITAMSLHTKIDFTPEEEEAWSIKDTETGVSWDENVGMGSTEQEFELSAKEFALVQGWLDFADVAGVFDYEMLSLGDKFLGPWKPPFAEAGS